MDWGLLQGLGDAAKTVGGAISENAKTQLAEKLQKDREDRAEERARSRQVWMDELKAKTVASNSIVKSDGVLWRQGLNSAGTPVGEKVLASQDEIDKFNFDEKARQAGLDKVLADTAKAKAEADNIGTKLNAEAALRNAQIDTERAQAENYRAQSAGTGGYADRYSRSGRASAGLADSMTPVNSSDVATSLMDEAKQAIKDEGLTDAEAYEVALASIKEARKQNKDPLDLFRRALPEYKARVKKRTPAGVGTGAINL